MGYAHGLGQSFEYTNTHYHREPKLDITDPDHEHLPARSTS